MEPLYKWMGGKRKLIPCIRAQIAAMGSYDTYYEPFLGGGAVWLALAPRKAVLSDLNPEIINFWRCLQANPTDFWRVIGGPLRVDQAEFLRLRACDPAAMPDYDRAYRFVILLYNAFGGRYRVNSKGLHNGPYNHNDKGAKALNPANYWAIADYVSRADITFRHQPYSAALEQATAADLLYLDPPYADTSDCYTKDGFDHPAFLAALARTRAAWVLSHHAPTSEAGYTALHLAWEGAAQWSLTRAEPTREVLYSSAPITQPRQLSLLTPVLC